jgi:hypothetical protein
MFAKIYNEEVGGAEVTYEKTVKYYEMNDIFKTNLYFS